MSINRVTISGNLTRDAELRYTQKGKAVSKFSVAMNDGYKDKETGEWLAKVSYIDCTLFGNRAEALDAYLKKGLKVCVAGKLDQQTWVDKTTSQNRSKHQILVDEIEMFRSKDDPAPNKVRVKQVKDVSEQNNQTIENEHEQDENLFEQEQMF